MALALGVAAFAVNRSALAYTADALTAVDANGTLTQRFFTGTSASPGAAAASGSVVWFVVDVNGDNTPNQPVNLSTILGADDVIVGNTTVGTGVPLPANKPGRLTQTFSTVPDGLNYENKSLYVIAFHSSTVTPGNIPSGTQFDILSIPQVAPSGLGNYKWYITQNLNDQDFTTSAVPEPSTFVLAGLGLAGMFAVRRFKK